MDELLQVDVSAAVKVKHAEEALANDTWELTILVHKERAYKQVSNRSIIIRSWKSVYQSSKMKADYQKFHQTIFALVSFAKQRYVSHF